MTRSAPKLVPLAAAAARRLQHPAIDDHHLLLALCNAPGVLVEAILSAHGVAAAALAAACERHLAPGPARVTSDQLPLTPAARLVLEMAAAEATGFGAPTVASEHLLLALLRHGGLPAQVLRTAGLDAHRTHAAVRSRLAIQHAERLPDRRLLLISNSTMHGGGYLTHCAEAIRDRLGKRQRVLFVPYALADHAAYTSKAAAAFTALGHDLVGAHTGDPLALLQGCDAVFVGGGNTFRLLDALWRTGLLPAIRQRAAAGMPYLGSSAGTNVATLSIRTTNDMPIVQPPTFEALALVPFQINPHYLDPDPHSKHMGETREERLRQFHEEHATPVLGLREGCWLTVDGDRIVLGGTTNARLFRRGQPPAEITPPCDLSFLGSPIPA